MGGGFLICAQVCKLLHLLSGSILMRRTGPCAVTMLPVSKREKMGSGLKII